VRAPRSVRSAEHFGRIRLSRNLFMREFFYSEIANVHGFTNLPSHPELAISAGRALCVRILEPQTSAFGRIAIRSGYRTPESVLPQGDRLQRSLVSVPENGAFPVSQSRAGSSPGLQWPITEETIERPNPAFLSCDERDLSESSGYAERFHPIE
jgi:hypothetical protein